jgi:hypothetical protein
MNLLTVTVSVVTVIAQLRVKHRLSFGDVPTGRIVEDNFRPATILVQKVRAEF